MEVTIKKKVSFITFILGGVIPVRV